MSWCQSASMAYPHLCPELKSISAFHDKMLPLINNLWLTFLTILGWILLPAPDSRRWTWQSHFTWRMEVFALPCLTRWRTQLPGRCVNTERSNSCQFSICQDILDSKYFGKWKNFGLLWLYKIFKCLFGDDESCTRRSLVRCQAYIGNGWWTLATVARTLAKVSD